MLATHTVMPREGHLYAVFREFEYLKTKHNARRVYDKTSNVSKNPSSEV
jgi:hypothetical protein